MTFAELNAELDLILGDTAGVSSKSHAWWRWRQRRDQQRKAEAVQRIIRRMYAEVGGA